MATRFLRKRTIAVGAATLLVVAACLCYLRHAEDSPDSENWLRFGYMAVFNVDLAKSGEYSVSFEARDIDPALVLEVPKDVGSRMPADALLAGLQATTELIDSRGEVLYAGRIPYNTPKFFPPDSGRIRLVEYGYSGVERHRINVAISQPALALRGVPHRLLVMSHNQNRAARSGKAALVFVGHAALFTAAAILIALAILSRRRTNSEGPNQGRQERG